MAEADGHVRRTNEPSRGLGRSLTYFGTAAAGQGLGFLLLPFVTRVFPPEEYGAYSLALAASGFVAVIASSWVRNVALRLYFDAVERGTTRGFFVGVACLQAVLFLTSYGALMMILAVSGIELASWRVLASAGVAVLVGDFAMFAFVILRAEQRALAFAISEISGGVLRFVLTLTGLALGLHSAELLFDATSVGLLVAGAYAVAVLSKRLTGPLRVDVERTFEVLRHGPASLPFSVANWIERLFDRLVIEHFLGTAIVGVYSIGYTLGERTIGMLVKAVFMMAWPSILAAWGNGHIASTRAAITEAHKLYAWFSVGPAFFMMVFGPEVLRLMTGASYHDAAPVVPIIAVSMWAEGFARFLNRHLELRKQFGTLSAFTMLGALVNLVLNIALVPFFGIMGAAWATLANRGFNLVVFYLIRDRTLVTVPVRTYGEALGLSVVLWVVVELARLDSLIAMGVYVVFYAPVALLAMRSNARPST